MAFPAVATLCFGIYAYVMYWYSVPGAGFLAEGKQDVTQLLLDLEEALHQIQHVEFLKPKEAERRARARDRGEAWTSDSSDDEGGDDDDDDDFFMRENDDVPKQTHEEKIESGLAYPVWHNKDERKGWRAGIMGKNAPGAAVAFAAAVLEDAAGPFLYAITNRPEPEVAKDGDKEMEDAEEA